MAIAAPTAASKAAPNAFAIALESFIADIKREEDIRSPFYKEVLSQLHLHASGRALEHGYCGTAEQLALFISELEVRQKRTSYTRKITVRLETLVAGLSQYTQACDVMIQAGPSAGALIYGGARIVLLLAEKFRKCFEDVLAMMESVGHLLRCYNVFAAAYEASTEMQQLLVATYKNIICFWQKAAKLFSRKAYKTLLSGIVKPLDLEWQRCRQALEDDSKRVTMFAQATEAGIRREKELKKESGQQAKLRAQIIDWIKAGQEEEALDVRQDIRSHLEVRHDDTCEWLFDHPDMEAWLKSRKSTTVWYSASPGSGKTILSSSVVRKLQDKGLKTATFFCSFNDLVRKRAITAIRSIALQLIGPTDNIPEKVKRLFEDDLSHHRSYLGDLKVAVEVLEAFLKQQSRIHIIVDGLDECEERMPLLAALCHLLHAKTYGIVKFFFASRPDSDIRLLMRKHGVKEIEAPQNTLMKDIRLYVAYRLDNCCEPCIEKWTTESEGNFLWVRHMMEILDGEHTTCDDEIDEELGKFPKGLTGCYTRSLSLLSERPERHQQLAQSIFTMVVGAVQPLRLRELMHALAASKGQADFSPGSLPKPELIEELCSNLVVFDRSSKGSEDDPLLKIAHKSIQDFFIQDPDTLELPDPRLKAYFVTPAKAYLELGLSSLNYLSYRRYSNPKDVSAIMNQDEHAFLKHAAIFWHRYLSDTNDTLELSKKVVEFVQSEAFWTCTAVQSYIAPHLFARYTRRFGGYSIAATGLKSKKEKCADDVCYAFPLPTWLDKEEYGPDGPRTVEAIHRLITEWHSILNTHPEALDQCVMDADFEKNIPGREMCQDSRGKLFSLTGGSSEALSVVDVQVERDAIMAQILRKDRNSGQYSSKWMQLFDETADSPEHPEPTKEQPFCQIASMQSTIFSVHSTMKSGYWKIDDSRLAIQYYPQGSQDRPTKLYTSERALGQWNLLSSAVNNATSPSQATVVVHCSESPRSNDDIFASQSSTSESGYASMASSDSDSDSDNGSLGYGNTKPLRNCVLVLNSDDSPPHWHFWKSKIDSEAQCVFHPTDRAVIWSPAPHELCIMDLDSKQVQATILPEPVDAKFSNVFAMRKDFHFSASGDTLYYLLYTAETLVTGVRQTVSLSSFLLNLQESEYVLERTHRTISIVYDSTGPIMHPLMLTHWGNDFVHATLPPLSCNAKVIRIPLPRLDTSSPHGDSVQTLRDPIYFPYSTPYRNPAIKPYIESSRREKFILSLGAEYATSDPPNRNSRVIKEAAIMTWDLDSRKAWRVWDEDRDSKEKGVKDNEEVYQKLRGSFVDKDRRFDVPVRSGLDWRRQAFLSCA